VRDREVAVDVADHRAREVVQIGHHDFAGLAGLRSARRAVGLAHDELDDHVLHRRVEPVVVLALRADHHHFATAVGIERGTERLFDRGALVREQRLRTRQHRERIPRPRLRRDHVACERRRPARERDHHVRLEALDLCDDARE